MHHLREPGEGRGADTLGLRAHLVQFVLRRLHYPAGRRIRNRLQHNEIAEALQQIGGEAPWVVAGVDHRLHRTEQRRGIPGGQLMITTEVENYPGFPESITGPELMANFQKQAERFHTVVHMENVVKLDLSKRPFHVKGESKEYLAETVIIATALA